MRSASIIAIEAEPSVDLYSAAIPVAQQDRASVIVSLTAGSTASGKVHIEASNDSGDTAFPVGNFVPTTWIEIPNTEVNINSTGEHIIPTTVLSYQFIRVVFDHSSGSGGTLTAKVTTAG